MRKARKPLRQVDRKQLTPALIAEAKRPHSQLSYSSSLMHLSPSPRMLQKPSQFDKRVESMVKRCQTASTLRMSTSQEDGLPLFSRVDPLLQLTEIVFTVPRTNDHAKGKRRSMDNTRHQTYQPRISRARIQ